MLSPTRVIGHKEWAKGRKSDPTYDMAWRRGRVATFVPRTGTTPPEDDDFMALFKTLEEFTVAVNRAANCRTPEGRTGAWPIDRLIGVDEKTGAQGDLLIQLVRLVADLSAEVKALRTDVAALHPPA